MRTKCVLVGVFILSLVYHTSLTAQTPMAFSLKQAQDYAFEHNFDLRNTAIDVQIASKEVKKNTAIGLPQVNGGIDYMDNFVIPTSVIPNFLSFLDTTGNAPKYLSVQFGMHYNMTASLNATQLVYSGQYLVGLQTAKAYLATVKQKMVRDKMDVRDLVAEAYISFLVVQESTNILDSTFLTIDQIYNEAKKVFEAGLIEDIDVDQLELNRSNLEASLMNLRSQQNIAYSYLKFVMGIQGGQEITCTDNLDFFLNSLNKDYLVNQPFDINFNIDYSLLKKQEYLVSMQYKLAKTAYQPSLIAFLGLSTNAYRQTWDFFDSNGKWYGASNWGLSLSIPIWSSGQRKYAVDQARLNLDKVKVVEDKTTVALNLQVETIRNDFVNSYNVFMNNKKSLETAKKIYDKTIEKYRLGVATSTDLNQRYNQFLQSESNYIQSILLLVRNQIKLSKLLERV
jgi:outer membrane protein TolC